VKSQRGSRAATAVRPDLAPWGRVDKERFELLVQHHVDVVVVAVIS
jgi:hypothetical protein